MQDRTLDRFLQAQRDALRQHNNPWKQWQPENSLCEYANIRCTQLDTPPQQYVEQEYQDTQALWQRTQRPAQPPAACEFRELQLQK